MPQDKQTSWWQISFTTPEPEERACILFEEGAGGVEILNDDTLRCFFSGDETSLQDFCERAAAHGFRCREKQKVPETNWLTKCQELWQPLHFDGLSIVPVMDESTHEGEASPETLFLIPGEGFGTGHHATTKTIVELLCSLRLGGFKPRSVLDVGTGSAILAIACAKLFRCTVDACDNDPAALKNAAVNVDLNQVSTHVKLSSVLLPQITAKYDLIVANIYAEVLTSLAPDFRRCINQGGNLILSGIASGLLEGILATFSEPDWGLKERRELDGWATLHLVFQRVSQC